MRIEDESQNPGAPEPARRVNRGWEGRRLAVSIEWLFGLAIILGIIVQVRHVLVDGYLPDPFLHSKADTFTDWYNPAYWANNYGAYSEWGSIYPPFCFVLLRLFTKPECYAYAVDSARECDPTGIVFITLFTILNFFLVWRVFWKMDRATAFPRALAVGLGFPVLFAWERGNLIVPCFTAFILAYGNLLKSARLKALCAALTLNFKPYLILAVVGRFVKRDWVWLEWCGLFFVAVYAASFVLFGSGDPMTIVRNTMIFEHTPGVDLISFTTTYTALLTIVKLPLPIMEIIGSAPLETVERGVPLLIYIGAAAVLPCLAYATLRPATCTSARASALLLIFFMTISTAPGGYSLQYALLFVFFERWSGAGRVLALACSYLWCIPLDIDVAGIYHDSGFSFLGQRVVQYELPITLGQLTRPGLLLLVEYGLAGATLYDIFRDLLNVRDARAARIASATA